MSDMIFAARQVNGLRRGIWQKGLRLQNISFELPAGYIMGIVGKNGAGKTTFFDYIMQDKKCYTGELLLEGREIHQNHQQALDRIGFVSEKNRFMELRSALQNAQMLGRFYSFFDKDLFRDILEKGKVSEHKIITEMSRGEQMKFQLAFAVAHKPKVFLLDEVTAGMDPVFRLDFYGLLHLLIKEEDCSVILSTHIEEEIEKQLDFVGVLEEGRWVSFGENKLI